MFGRHFAFALAGKTLLEAKQMSMIRLEHENFAAAERLESVLRERLLNVVAADADAGGITSAGAISVSLAVEPAVALDIVAASAEPGGVRLLRATGAR